MVARLRLLAVAVALGPLAVLAPAPAIAQERIGQPIGEPVAEPIVLARSMLEVLAPQTNEVAGILIDVLDADGSPDPAKLSGEEWAAMETAAERLRDEAIALRSRPIQVVADPGDKIFGEETSGLTAADVQAMIDANRADFDVFLDVILYDFDRMRAAITARDAQEVWAISAVLDVKCNACHERFWYPDWQEDAIPPP